MTAPQPAVARRVRRAIIVLWSAAGAMLICSGVIIAFSVAQSIAFNAAQQTGGTVNPSFWLQLSWAIQSLPGVLLTVGFAAGVTPFFLLAVTTQGGHAEHGSHATDADGRTAEVTEES